MTTITIKRGAPVSASYPDSTLILSGEINKPEVINAMTPSLSGSPNDYFWRYEPTEYTVSIIARASYQERFKVQKTQLEKLLDKVERIKQADEYANNVLKRSQTYTRMGRGRNFYFSIRA